MSWQMALTAASTAASIAGTAASMSAAKGKGAMNSDAMVAQGNSARRTAAGLRDQAAEVDVQVAMEENQRMSAYQQMMAANTADLPTRGINDSASGEAILSHNRDAAATDLMSVKYMGSAKSKRLLASADANDEAANTFYKGGVAAISQGDTESSANFAKGGWQLMSSMPNMVSSVKSGWKDMSGWFGGGGSSTSTPGPMQPGAE